MGGANSAQCHQQLPILGIKHTGAQELGYRPQVVERKVAGPSWAWKSAAKSKLLRWLISFLSLLPLLFLLQ